MIGLLLLLMHLNEILVFHLTKLREFILLQTVEIVHLHLDVSELAFVAGGVVEQSLFAPLPHVVVKHLFLALFPVV
jgi:hypothetical protein